MSKALVQCMLLISMAAAFCPPPSRIGHVRESSLTLPSKDEDAKASAMKQQWVLGANINNDSNDEMNDGENSNESEDEASRLQQKAEQLRAQIRAMEEQIGSQRRARMNNDEDNDSSSSVSSSINESKSLSNKKVLVVGANGRLGSMVTRHLLRNHPEVSEVIAAVHYVGRATTRGYGRLSYEVGAEDGIGTLAPAWSLEEDRNASFEYDPQAMAGYNLNKLRVVEVELLDPVQVQTIVQDCNVDCVLYCATDFEGNRPRAVASLNAAFLFRAVANPTKGRVEIEGLRNCLEALLGGFMEKRWQKRRIAGEGGAGVAAVAASSQGSGDASLMKPTDPTAVVLVSTSPDAFGQFETPFGEFNGLKRQGEQILQKEFPSLSYTILQMGRFDERVEEELDLLYELVGDDDDDDDSMEDNSNEKKNDMKSKEMNEDMNKKWDGRQRKINRRDAARAAVEALLDEDLVNKKVRVYTSLR